MGEGPVLPPRRVGAAGPGLGSAHGLRDLQTEKFSYFTVYPCTSHYGTCMATPCGVRIRGGGGGGG